MLPAFIVACVAVILIGLCREFRDIGRALDVPDMQPRDFAPPARAQRVQRFGAVVIDYASKQYLRRKWWER